MFGSPKHKPIDVGRTSEAAEFLATELERLMALPLATPEDVADWYSESKKSKATLREKFPQFEFYDEVWHFFDDADVRARDSGYRDHQHRLMSDYITRLRNEPANA
jgi:hypothetical protein